MSLRDFYSWLQQTSARPDRIEYIQIGRWAQESGRSQDDWPNFLEFANDSFTDFDRSSKIGVIISGSQDREIHLRPREEAKNFLAGFSIHGTTAPILIENCWLESLEISGGHSVKVTLSDLWIDRLFINTTRSDFHLNNCYIGTLTLHGAAARDFEVRRGAVLDIRCAPPTGEAPFSGSVYFDGRVYLPRKPGIRLAGPQPYRNLRAHMMKLENAQMVNRFHALEQSVERHNENLFNRFISCLYGIFSDYGASSLRPVFWFLFSAGLLFLSLYVMDGASVNAHMNASDWHSDLLSDDPAARAKRALALVLSATFNPLGVFGINNIVVAKSIWLTIWLLAHGVFSTLCLALFIFALRRRFKLL